MVAAREVECDGGGVLKPSGPEAKEVGATDTQELSSSVRVEVATVESGEGLVEELEGQAFCELRFGILH